MRISLLGGGSDYPEHFRTYGGCALGAALAHYSYLSIHRLPALFDYKIRVSYSRTETVNDIESIEHPSVRESMRYLNCHEGVEIHYAGDLPARTGLGTSSSFTVGMLHALHALQGDVVSRERLAEEAVYVEREMIRERVGLQDQYLCALGGVNFLVFERDGTVKINPVPMSRSRLDELESRLMLFYTGIQRHAHDLLQEQFSRMESGDISASLQALEKLARRGFHLLGSQENLSLLGELLHEAWNIKKSLSSRVTSSAVDGLYERARSAGASGGKLLGAGGGGFLLLYAEPECQQSVADELKECPQAPVRFDLTGSRLLFYAPEEALPVWGRPANA